MRSYRVAFSFPLSLLLLAAASGLLLAASGAYAAQAKKPSSTKSVKSSAAKSTSARKPAAKRATTSHSTRRRTTRRRTTVRARSYRYGQMKPTSERYREIQQALTARGYQTPVDGVWGTESTEALKKFQSDQNLTADGKLTSLTIIGLGLGPQRNGNSPASLAPVRKEQP